MLVTKLSGGTKNTKCEEQRKHLVPLALMQVQRLPRVETALAFRALERVQRILLFLHTPQKTKHHDDKRMDGQRGKQQRGTQQQRTHFASPLDVSNTASTATDGRRLTNKPYR